MANILPLDKALEALADSAAIYAKKIEAARNSNHVLKVVRCGEVAHAWSRLASAQWEVEEATKIERARQTPDLRRKD